MGKGRNGGGREGSYSALRCGQRTHLLAAPSYFTTARDKAYPFFTKIRSHCNRKERMGLRSRQTARANGSYDPALVPEAPIGLIKKDSTNAREGELVGEREICEDAGSHAQVVWQEAGAMSAIGGEDSGLDRAIVNRIGP